MSEHEHRRSPLGAAVAAVHAGDQFDKAMARLTEQSDGVPGPALTTLRAASESLMAGRLIEPMTAMLTAAISFERFLISAQAVGATKDQALEAIRAVQGLSAGSTPSAEDLRAALDWLLCNC